MGNGDARFTNCEAGSWAQAERLDLHETQCVEASSSAPGRSPGVKPELVPAVAASSVRSTGLGLYLFSHACYSNTERTDIAEARLSETLQSVDLDGFTELQFCKLRIPVC